MLWYGMACVTRYGTGYGMAWYGNWHLATGKGLQQCGGDGVARHGMVCDGNGMAVVWWCDKV